MRISQQRLTADGDLLSNLLRKAADLDLQRYELEKLRDRFRQAQEFATESFPMGAQYRQPETGSTLSM